MKNLFSTQIVLLVFFMMITGVGADESTEVQTGPGSRGELDAAWRDGFMTGMEDWKYVSFDENLDFHIPLAIHQGVFFEAGFSFNGSGWDLDASSIDVFDNVLLLTKEDDGGTFTLQAKGVLRIKLDVVPIHYHKWCFIKAVDPEILYNVRYIFTSYIDDIPWLAEAGRTPVCAVLEEEWVFVADKSGVVELEMAACPDHAQCGAEAGDFFSVEIVVE